MTDRWYRMYDDQTNELLGVLWYDAAEGRWMAETVTGELIARCGSEDEARGLLRPLRAIRDEEAAA